MENAKPASDLGRADLGRGADRDADCLIVGGGPAGLTAAVYLARFRRDALLIDAGEPRAALIPTSRNCPGFPDGIRGPDLLRAMRMHAEHVGPSVERLSNGKVDRVDALAVLEPRQHCTHRGVVVRSVVHAHPPEHVEVLLVGLERREDPDAARVEVEPIAWIVVFDRYPVRQVHDEQAGGSIAGLGDREAGHLVRERGGQPEPDCLQERAPHQALSLSFVA